MIIRLTLNKDSTIEDYNNVFINSIDNLLKIVNELKKDFKSIS